MRKKLADMRPVDDFVTRKTPGLKILEENWGGMQCAYHIFARGTDFTEILKGKGLQHDLCGVEHWAYILKGSLEVIYLDGTVEICRAGEVCSGQLRTTSCRRKGPRSSSSAPLEGAAQGKNRGDARKDEEVSVYAPGDGRT